MILTNSSTSPGTTTSGPNLKNPETRPEVPAPIARPTIATAEIPGLPNRMTAAALLAPINNWEFAERVWTGLRPHLRTRLWVLEALQSRSHVPHPGIARESEELEQLASEIHRVEDEVDQVLQRRSSLSEFSSLLERRLAPCLGQLEQLQQALHERHYA